MLWNENPWAPWGLMMSSRDGHPTLAESMLWELEARHPQVVRRTGKQIFVHLDQVYQLVEHPDRAYYSLVAVGPSAETGPVPVPPGGEVAPV